MGGGGGGEGETIGHLEILHNFLFSFQICFINFFTWVTHFELYLIASAGIFQNPEEASL